jgi:hypothetical protein
MPIILKLMIAFYAWLAYRAAIAAKMIPKYGRKEYIGGGGRFPIGSITDFDQYSSRPRKSTEPPIKIDRSKAFNIDKWDKEQLKD